ncbi:GFA family protein, partial [bacterium M00.F.Ca.ET.229.01.1.1]
ISHVIIGMIIVFLDDPSFFRPQMHMWTASKQPWVMFDDGLPQYEGAPPA